MWQLELNAGQCLCCGICVDICAPRALALRRIRTCVIDGRGDAKESFPYLANPGACDGCSVCVVECPVAVMRIVAASESAAMLGGD